GEAGERARGWSPGGAIGRPEPPRQVLERARAALVERDDLAVEQQIAALEPGRGRRYLGKRGGDVAPGTRPQPDLPVASLDQRPHAVVLELEDPALGRERLPGGAGRARPGVA